MTLIEVMMVVFIIGLATGLVVLTLPPRATPEEAAAKTFSSVLTRAQDQAILSGQPVGLLLGEEGYSLLAWRGEQWDRVRGGAELARGLTLQIDDRREQVLADGWPDLVFDPTGVSDGAMFQLRGRKARIDITLLASGEVQLETR